MLEEFGMGVIVDSVVSTVPKKYFNPKEVLVQNGVLNRVVSILAGFYNLITVGKKGGKDSLKWGPAEKPGVRSGNKEGNEK